MIIKGITKIAASALLLVTASAFAQGTPIKDPKREKFKLALRARQAVRMTKSGVEMIILPVHKAPRTDAAVHQAFTQLCVQYACQPIFKQSVLKSLEKSIGGSEIKDAALIRFEDQAAADQFVKKAADENWPISIEPNAVATSQSEPLESLQWGIHNSGDYPEDLLLTGIGLYEHERLTAVKGQDAHLPDSVAIRHKVKVAVIDTGIDVSHPNLAGQFGAKKAECAKYEEYAKCVNDLVRAFKTDFTACNDKYLIPENDLDHNGYPLDCYGWDFASNGYDRDGITGSPLMDDEVGHGTHVAGIIAGARNKTGIRGVAADSVELIPVRVLIDTSPAGPGDARSHGYSFSGGPAMAFADTVARGIVYAVNAGAQVINMSLGWPYLLRGKDDQSFSRRMIDWAINQGVILVAAAGNDRTDYPILPCSLPGVVCVGAHQPDGRPSDYTDFGSAVSLFAPGDAIFSTIRHRDPFGEDEFGENWSTQPGYDLMTGSSMAAPHVAGALALCLATKDYSNLDDQKRATDECRSRIVVGARPTEKDPDGKYALGGLLSIKESLEISKARPVIFPEDRGVLSLVWDRKLGSRIDAPLTLKNRWAAAAKPISVEVTLDPEWRGRLELQDSKQTFASWSYGEAKVVSPKLIVRDKRIPSELMFHVSIRGDEISPLDFQYRGEIQAPIGRDFEDDVVQSIPFVENLSADSKIRPITPADGDPKREYLITIIGKKPEDPWTIRMLRPTPDGSKYFETQPRTIQPLPPGALWNAIYRLDINLDGKPDYVFMTRMPADKVFPHPYWRFTFLDSELGAMTVDTKKGPKSEILFSNSADETFLPKADLGWMKVGAHLAPVWAGIGHIPLLQQKTVDRTKPFLHDARVKNSPDNPINLYYLTDDGLKMVMDDITDPTTGTKYFVLKVLPQSRDQLSQGKLPILLGTGLADQMEFALAEAYSADGDVKIRFVQAMPLEQWSAIGKAFTIDTRVLDPTASSESQVSFAVTGKRGGLTFSQLRMNWRQDGAHPDFKRDDLTPDRNTDTYFSIPGAFIKGKSRTVFIQTKYDLVYADVANGEQASTSLRRFSFLPGNVFDSAFFPLLVDNGTGGRSDLTGAMQVPANAGVSESQEIIVPTRTADGKLMLIRPAMFRLTKGAGCMLSEDAYEPSTEKPAYMDVICQNRIIRVPLAFERR